MTVAVQIPFASFTASGSATFAYAFKVNASTDLIVKVNGTTQASSLYSVTGVGTSSGSVVFITAPATGSVVSIQRKALLQRTTDYQNNGDFLAGTVNPDFDALWMAQQDAQYQLGLALQISASDSSRVSTTLPTPSANKLLGWNSTATEITNTDPSTLASLVAYGSTAIDTFTGTGSQTAFTLTQNPSSQNNLGVFLNGLGLTPGVDFTWNSSAPLVLTMITAPTLADELVVRYQVAMAQGSGTSDAITYTPTGTGAVATTVQTKLRESVSVKDFGAKGDGVTDDTASIASATTYASSNKCELVFPAGTYLYTSAPNWGIQDFTVSAKGKVVLKYTGTGNAVVIDGGSSTTQVFNVRMLGDFNVLALGTSLNGVFVRAAHHSRIEARVAGCGTTSAGLLVNFSVCSEFNVVVSSNEQSFGTARPLNGYVLSSRGALEQCAACTFYNPVIEGVPGDGIVLTSAIKNTFIGGTSEGVGGFGIKSTSNSTQNNFIGIDLEGNPAGDISEAGAYNTYINILSGALVTVSGNNILFSGGTLQGGLTNSGNTELKNVSYSGTITNTGKLAKSSVFNILSSKYDIDLKLDSLSNLISVPSGVATTILTLPTTGNHMYHVVAYSPNQNAFTYGAYAVVYQDGTSTTRVTGVDAAIVSITVVGSAIKVTQTAGVAINIQAFAQVI